MAKTAARMTGRLNVVRKVQTRTLRNQHVDQHWVNSLTRNYLEWLVDLKHAAKAPDQPRSFVAFIGMDDKAKIPIGDKVAVSSNVRYSTKAIVPLDKDSPGNIAMNAADHDWKCSNIVPSVTLHANIPDRMSESFFGGG